MYQKGFLFNFHCSRPLFEPFATHSLLYVFGPFLNQVPRYVDAAAANYRSLNRQLRHGGRLQKAALGHRQRLDQLAKIAPPLLEPLTLWRGFSSLSFVSYLHHLQKADQNGDSCLVCRRFPTDKHVSCGPARWKMMKMGAKARTASHYLASMGGCY